ncbi:MAG: BON domain-containing protein [Pseudomonadota bacterium]|nr:BON domain-containing protein [Pseudomonadota bacterium]
MIHSRIASFAGLAPGVVRVALLSAVAVATLSGCAPLLLGGAVFGGGLMAADRRTTGIQVEDEAIELKAGSRVGNLATLGHINITSYNRVVLITGEVPGGAQKVSVGATVAGVENVRSIANELVIAPNSSIASRSGDTVLTSKVKASLVDAKDVQANAFKVVTERNVVYLMGRVTDRESRRAAEIASAVSGVRKVVRVFEIVSETELNDIAPQAAGSAPSR